MLDLTGYAVGELLHEGPRSLVHRARRMRDGASVVVKTLREEPPSAEDVAGLERAFELARDVPKSAVVGHLELVRHRTGVALVTEDLAALSLDRLMPPGGLPLGTFLDVAIELAHALAELHASGIVHRDLKPHNVVARPDWTSVRIIDLGLATRLDRDLATAGAIASGRIEGTLAYVSPEQTGRMNRPVDHRSDLYSLGATLYVLAAGRVPFAGSDAMELVHAHLARRPRPPHELTPTIPAAVSDIVLKLLAKSADERYASALGVARDLEHCREMLRATGSIERFELARHDVRDAFLIPERLYGRERDVAALMSSFERAVAGGRELVLVSGFSGIGKSVLVHEIQRPVAIRAGFFCAGKFDQFRRDLPYLALIDALRDLMRRVLTEPDDRIAERRRALDEALGANAAVITQVVPELELILGGPPPPVAEVGPTEAMNRFRRTFSMFVRAFARAEHPLVLFLDDVQWADAASIALLESLASDRDAQHLMIVLGQREERDDPRSGHALATALARLEEAGQPVLRLALAPLDEPTVGALIADTLHRPAREIAPLAALVHARTRGNPFFTRELLLALHRSGAIALDRQRNEWTWDEARVAAAGIHEDVVALMTSRIRDLPASAARVLQIAACIGATFDLATLALVTERTRGEVAGELDAALAEGLVAPVDAAHRLVGALSSLARRRGEGDTDVNARYRFVHDRVQQAAHAMVPAAERRALHLAIARHLIAATPDPQMDEIVIDVVDHLGVAIDALVDPAERLRVARLFLRAGQRAASSMAIEPACRYFEEGLSLLPGGAWERHHDLALALTTHAADMLYRRAEYRDADARAAQVLEHAKSDLERVPIWGMQVRAGLERNAYREAVDVALHALDRLGLSLPRNPTTLDVLAGVARVFVALGRRSPMALRALPRMRDPVHVAILDLLQETATTSYFDQPNLFALCAIHAARLSITHGNTKVSAFGYALFGVILCGALERFELGHEFGRLAEAVLEDTGARELEGPVLLATRNFINPWKEPLAGLHPLLRQSYASVLDSGNVTYAVYNGTAGFYDGFFAGAQLDALVDGNADLIRSMRGSGQHQAMPMLESWLQAAEQLRDEQRHDGVLRGPIYDHDAKHEELVRTKNKNGIGHASAAAGMIAYLFGDLDRAHRWLEVAADHVEHVLSQPVVPVIRFYRGLTALALARRERSAMQRAKHLVTASLETRRLKGWAAHSPVNLEHKVVLLEAERARTDRRDGDAVVLYQRAIALARAHGFMQEEALAAERMSEHASERGMSDLAAHAMGSAFALWRRWGARGKAAELAARRRLAVGVASQSAATGSRSSGSTSPLFDSNTASSATSRGDEALDLATVIKAVRLISREIELARLLERTLELAIENAGADRGALVLAREAGLFVEAESSVDDEGARIVTEATPLRAHSRLPVSLLEYAFRTSETVVVADGPTDRLFARDPHIEREGTRSMMAVPLLLQGKRVGVIYVENRLTAGAFTAARRSVLETIGGQAAIALENAKLYEDLCRALEKQVELAIAHARFVPHQFLSTLRRENILEVRLGDHAQKEMSILFSDIRGFTSIVEKLSVAEALSFINEYLAHMEPAIREHGGFIDTLLGDGIMALYDGAADNAVRGGIAMFRGLERYNEERAARGKPPVKMGIGVSTGVVMLGTIGGGSQMKCGVIGDSVNLAARLEGLTKQYGAHFLVSDRTVKQLTTPRAFHIRPVERVRVVGRDEPVTLHEVLDAAPASERALKLSYLPDYLAALDAYYARDFATAGALFDRCRAIAPDDVAVAMFVSRIRALREGVPSTWDGVETLTEK